MKHAESSHVDQVANAVLYEGYMLYPYRPSTKNRQRWTFGGLLPRNYSELNGGFENWRSTTQCLVAYRSDPQLTLRMRCLHLMNRDVGRLDTPLSSWPPAEPEPYFERVESLRVKDREYHSWQEAVERDAVLGPVSIDAITQHPAELEFDFPATRTVEPIADSTDRIVAVFQRTQLPLRGTLTLSAEPVEPGLIRLSSTITNTARMPEAEHATRNEALMHGLVSCHQILHTENGQFISQIDPPDRWRAAASKCRNSTCWPVLVGDKDEANTMLAAPIILYDYPEIAPQSPGDLFDGTEIDEILSLRVMTLTEDEKRQAAAMDDRTRSMLERTDSLSPDQFMAMHSAMRGGDPVTHLKQEPIVPESVDVSGRTLRPGDRVRLNPGPNADAIDVVLRGLTATIASIEQDFEGQLHLAVTIDDDPGADYGRSGQPGHRFFFAPEDVEPLAASEQG